MRRVVLVTGGAGYIGSHVCKALSQQGFLPITYDNLCSGNKGAVQWGPFEYGDIRDEARLAEVMRQYRPEVIMHFAALIQVAESVQSPEKYKDNNIYGSQCLLELAGQFGIKNIIFSSTAAVYGSSQTGLLDENTPCYPINPYGETKLAVEKMMQGYAKDHNANVAILRYFNAAGADPECETGTAYKKDTHIIPLLMKAASGDLPTFTVFGRDYETSDGTALRDYVHVSDVADAHIKAMHHMILNNESLLLNIGTSKGVTVNEVVEAAINVTQVPIDILYGERREGDPAVLVADASLARATLNWKPQYSDIQTIIKTAWSWRLHQKGMQSSWPIHQAIIKSEDQRQRL